MANAPIARMGSLSAWISPLAVALALAACSSTPPPKDEPLLADPPLATDPASAKSNPELDRGVAFVKNGKFAEAKPHLEAALKSDAKSAEANFYMAMVTEQTGGDKAEAERLYKKSLTLDPKLVEAAQNLAAMYLDEPARPDEAIPLLEDALKQIPGEPKILQNLGYAYSLKKDNERAAKAYKEALAKDDNPQLRFALGTLLFEAKKPEEAAPHLIKAAEAMMKDAAALATIARMLGPAKAFDDCVRLLDAAIALKADQPEFFVRRGVCKHELKKEVEAGKDYEAAIKLDGKYQPAHYYRALSLLAQKNTPGAKAELRKTVELGKDTPVGKQAKEKLDSLR